MKDKFAYEVYRDSAVPYIGKFSLIDGTDDIVFCRFLWARFMNFDHYQMTKRGMLVCGIPVEKCEKFVESNYSVLDWITKPTRISDLPTGFPHKPSIEIL